jgi:iron complex outermembrane recepter protein
MKNFYSGRCRSFLNSTTAVALVCSHVAIVHAQDARPTGATDEAADEDDRATNEIIVTATRRSEKLSDVAMSINAYDTEIMDRRSINDIGDIAAVTPGLSAGAGVGGRVAIRGVASDVVGASPTAIYLDDMPLLARSTGLAMTTSNLPKIFDLDRIEVLKGPQGTLFGAGAMGGAIRFITPQPGLTEYSGYARAEVAHTSGGAMSNEAGVAFGGPIVDGKLGFRVSGWQRRDGGYIDHNAFRPGLTEANANHTQSYVARAALVFAPTDNVTITASYFIQDLKENDASVFSLQNDVPGQTSDVANNIFIKNDLTLEPSRDKIYVPSLRIEADLGGVNLTSVTTHLKREGSQLFDYSIIIPTAVGADRYWAQSQNDYEAANFTIGQRNFAQEIRLSSDNPSSKLKWTVGAYYAKLKQKAYQDIVAPTFDQLLLDTFGADTQGVFGAPLLPGFRSAIVTVDSQDEQLAGFANLDYEFAAGLSVNAGVRVDRQKNAFQTTNAGPLVGGTSSSAAVQKETPITPKFGIDYKPNDDNLFYLSAAKGYRPGGVNKPVIIIPNSPCAADAGAIGAGTTYGSDTLWSYEAGAKNKFFDNRVRTSASVYYIKWKDIQQRVFVPSCLDGFVANLGKATSKGFDLQVDADVSDDLSVDLAVGYTSAKFSEDSLIGGQVFRSKGDQVFQLAPWTIVAGLDYRLNLSDSANGYVRIENRYQSKNKGQQAFQNPLSQSFDNQFRVNEAVNELNIRAGVKVAGFDVSAYVNNLLNSHALNNVYFKYPDAYEGAKVNRPRTAGLTGVYRW